MEKTDTSINIAIIKLGGSATIDSNGVAREYIKQLVCQLYTSLEKYAHVVFVIGGGKRVKDVIATMREQGYTEDEQDQAGIDILVDHAAGLKACIEDALAELGIREEVEEAPRTPAELQDKIQGIEKRFLVVSGLQKGQSTDTNAVLAAEFFTADTEQETHAVLLFLSNVWHAWTDDPHPQKNPEYYQKAKPIRRANIQVLSEQENARGAPILARGQAQYKPGSPGILDPVAVDKLITRPQQSVYYTHADNILDMQRFLTGQEPADGTIFVPEIIETEYYAVNKNR